MKPSLGTLLLGATAMLAALVVWVGNAFFGNLEAGTTRLGLVGLGSISALCLLAFAVLKALKR